MKKRQGKGTFTDGAETYVGEWKDDDMHGAGTFTFASGAVFEVCALLRLSIAGLPAQIGRGCSAGCSLPRADDVVYFVGGWTGKLRRQRVLRCGDLQIHRRCHLRRGMEAKQVRRLVACPTTLLAADQAAVDVRVFPACSTGCMARACTWMRRGCGGRANSTTASSTTAGRTSHYGSSAVVLANQHSHVTMLDACGTIARLPGPCTPGTPASASPWELEHTAHSTPRRSVG